MALDLTAIADALAARLANADGLAGRTAAFKPGSDPTPPFGYVGWPVPPGGGRLAIEYGRAGTQYAPGATTAYFPIVVVVAGSKLDTAQLALQPYLASKGASSVVAALYDDGQTPLLEGVSIDCPGVEHIAFNGSIGSALWLVEVVASMD